LAVQKSLNFGAAFVIEAAPLVLGFDPLRGSRYSKTGAESHNSADDCKALFVREQILDERLIDLELVELEAAQVADAGIAGTEIVQRNSDPKLMQLIENPDVVIGSFKQNRFGDLQLKSRCRQTRRRQCVHHRRYQIALRELHRRQVDRNGDIVRPAHRFGARFPQRPLAEPYDQTGILRQRNEFDWRYQAALGMLPTH